MGNDQLGETLEALTGQELTCRWPRGGPRTMAEVERDGGQAARLQAVEHVDGLW